MQTASKATEKITMAAASDTGNLRDENEDFYFFSLSKKFFIVCDGMGGHDKGALASKIAGVTLRDLIFASETLREIVIDRGRIFIGHVGDSRVYRLRQGKLSCLTSDHSWLNELLEDKDIAQTQTLNFQEKNVLTRALGVSPAIQVDLQIEAVKPGDLYLLCSDGLSDALSNTTIQNILSAGHDLLQTKITDLVSQAKFRDGTDDITGGLIQVPENWPDENISPEKHVINEEPHELLNTWTTV